MTATTSRLLDLAVIAALALTGYACGESEASLQHGLSATVEVTAPQGPDGSIPLSLVLRNPGDQAVTIYGGGGCPGIETFDFIVERDGQEVWSRYRNIDVICSALVQLTLQPDREKTFGDTWNKRDNDGQPASSGTYTVTGVLHLSTEDATPDFDLRTGPQELVIS